MKRRVISILLTLMMVLSLVPAQALAVGEAYTAREISSDYFYDQLNERSKAIYTKLLEEFTGAETKAKYYDGTEFIDLIDLPYEGGVIDQETVSEYIEGNKDIFNDFCAAKDALDLDHSELWYIDSGYLTFRVTKEDMGDDKYHILIGPGRGETYLLGGETIEDVEDMDKHVNETIDHIVASAVDALNAANKDGTYSDADKLAFLVTNIHDQITKGIHYRYEIECTKDTDNARYIRTIYGIQTHEGVCEAYARTLQVALRRVGVECVLIHGVQTKGTPEDHMWNAVNIPDDAGDHWYVVDATWDDPLAANWDGSRDLTFNYGDDGKETNTYLMVGQSVVGQYWRPSGFVSTGNFEFTYPTIETYGYAGASVEGDFNGLEVKYSAGGAMEDGTPAGVFTVTYKGMNAAEAREQGLYFMVRMYDYHSDGTADVMDEWYYADASFILASDSPFFGDHPGGLRIYTATCEYVEIAVTTREPEHRDDWSSDPWTSYLSLHPEAGYFQGDEREIIAQTGMLYNVNASYEAPPYVKTQTPAPNGTHTAGYEYDVVVTWDDDLYHILPGDTNAANGIAAVDAFEDYYEQAKAQKVQVRYTTLQEDLHSGGVKTHQVVGDLPFDVDRDGVVDMDSTYTDFHWHYSYEGEECPNAANHGPDGACDVEKGCPINGVSFKFNSSDLWIDDATAYNFTVEGVVGSRSHKYPNNFEITVIVPGLCPYCYRSQGIDWNLWGQPTLLDAPENLDLHAMAEAGGTDKDTLAELDAEMNKDKLNGRLMLVVEDKSQGAGSRTEYEQLNQELEDSQHIDGEIAARSVFEINFNRLCPKVKLKPNNGESIRVQVGYPAGITYESLGSGEYEIKAYHFTRCANNGEDICDEYKAELEAAIADGTSAFWAEDDVKRAHSWGSHIVSVEQIEIIPTPYGMVIMCSAFSPFEIVAVKKDTPVAVSAGEHDVIVVSDMNGKVQIDGKDAVGADGNRKVADGESLTFTPVPNSGYVVDTVSFGGDAIERNDDGSYTLSNVKKSDVLSVTFIPQTVQQEEISNGQTTVVAKVCTHTHTEPLKDGEHQADVAPTCTAEGYKLGTKCTDCGQTLTLGKVVPATGHTNITVTEQALAATCTTAGHTAASKCETCGAVVSARSDIQALGHLFTKFVETNEHTCQGTVTEAKCDRGCDVTERGMVSWGSVDHVFDVLKETVEATCTENKVEIMKCKWCDATEEKEFEGTALGHKPGEDGLCERCHEPICADGAHTPEVVKGYDATCTEDGLTDGEKCSVCGVVLEPQVTIPAQGHKFPPHDHDESVKCENCDEMSPTEEHTVETIPGREPTCTENGLTEGKKCSVCGDILEPQEVIPATGHKLDMSTLTWVWSTDGQHNATATVKCGKCDYHENHTATVTEIVTKEATCEETGLAAFKAVVTIEGQEYTDTQGSTEIPALGHQVDEYKPDTDASCSVLGHDVGTCARCGKEVRRERTEYLPHTIAINTEKSSAPTCTTEGKEVGACVVCGYVDAENTIPALGHSFTNYLASADATCQGIKETATCDRCDATDTRLNPAGAVDHKFTKHISETPATCTENATETLGCEWCDATTVEVKEGTATGHSFGPDGICTVCHEYACKDGHQMVDTEALEPTCTENGHTAGRKCSVCGTWEIPEEVILPLGHDFDGHTAGSKCRRCGQELLRDEHTPVPMENVPATCDHEGTEGGTKCAECGQIITEPRIVPALGHDWDNANPVWNWSTEGGISASVTLTCTRDRTHTQTFTATLDGGVTTKPATCTEDGTVTYTATVTLENEEPFIDTKEITVPATGHIWDTENPVDSTEANCAHHATVTYKCENCDVTNTVTIEGELKEHTIVPDPNRTTPPTCTEPGKTYGVCSVCGHVDAENIIPALGHSFTNYLPTDDATCQGIKETATCDRCDATDTRLNPAGAVDHKFTKHISETPATCTENATETLGCEWCDATTVEVKEGTAKGHSFGPDGICTVCHEYACKDGHKMVDTEALEPTCTENGHTAGRKCSVCGTWEIPEEVILPLGHDFDGHTAGSKCRRCGQELLRDEHTPVPMENVPATCDHGGTEGGTKCAECGQIITEPRIVPALGHDWDNANPVWNWSTEGGISASVTLTCTRDRTHTQTFTATLDGGVTTKPATCTEDGTVTYTATVTLENEEPFIDTKEITVPATGHIWDTENPVDSTEANCAHHATVTYKCVNCDVTNTVTIEGELKEHTIVPDPDRTTPPTCTEPGKTYGICSVCGHVIAEPIGDEPALGHSYGPYRTVTPATCTEPGLERADCVRGDTYITRAVAALGHNFVDGVCTRCGITDPASPDEPEEPAGHPVIREYAPFEDVPAESWYEADLKYSYERGLIGGTGADTFSPNSNITRIQMMTLLARFDYVEDASSDDWAQASLAWAINKGISDGTDPEGEISREALVTMLWRYYGCPTVENDLSAFTDADRISGWARSAFAWAVDAGIINGATATELRPQRPATRAQAASIFARFARSIEK